MDSTTIRQRFLDFFKEREHTLVPSSSLVATDPSLLFTNAGMNQFTPYFTGQQRPPFKRAVSAQKCFRTVDIEGVGTNTRTLTFFQMLGNFSFGDYYKERACPWAWELVTEGWEIDPERLWVTIYQTDDEAFEVWTDLVGVRPERILRLGREENYWDMGVAGPCGPDSEIFVDLGERYGEASELGPVGNDERYMELWNLVFMQSECNDRIEPIADLPSRNIDTGAGLERVARVLQGADSVFETDQLGGMVLRAEELVGRKYASDSRTDMGLRILADHGRGITFLVADGVLPSNEKRGYVLRRVMRRAIRHARLLGREEPVLPALVDTTIALLGEAYPELVERRDLIADVVAREEERFAATLKQGSALLEQNMTSARERGDSTIGGDVAFKLHDTFGFPVDLTREIAREAGLEVDVGTFESLMSEQRTRARAAREFSEERSSGAALRASLESRGSTEFIGYEHLLTTGEVLALARGEDLVPVVGEGDHLDVVLDRTVFYPQGGGQVGDRGILTGPSGEASVLDTRRMGDVIVHRVDVTAGELRAGDELQAVVDAERRVGAQRAHTATHVLHWLLRDRLGEHATQAGSLVEPGRLRFDFHHFESLSPEELSELSEGLAEKVFVDDGVRAYETSFEFARSIGAMAIFGEKYGDFVRVVEVGEYSKELCGGTHVAHTSQVGPIVLLSESSVGSNLRRVEALVGRDGLEFLRRRAATLTKLAETLHVSPEEVAGRVERLVEASKDLERRLADVDRQRAESDARALVEGAVDVDGSRLVVARRDVEVDALKTLAQRVKGRLDSAVIVLGAAGRGRANLVGAVSGDLTARGLSARELLAPGARLLGGGAGGKPELAISGGPAADRLDEAIEAVARAARDALTR